jgi:hypothetical protein
MRATRVIQSAAEPAFMEIPERGNPGGYRSQKKADKKDKTEYVGRKMASITGGYNLQEKGVAAGQDRIAGVLRRALVSWKKTSFERLRGEFFPLEGGPLPDFSTTEPTAWVPLAEAGIMGTDATGIIRAQFFPHPNDTWCVGSGTGTFGVAGVTAGCRGFSAFPKLQGSGVSDSMIEGFRCTGFRILIQAVCNDFNNQGTVAVALAPHQSGISGYPSSATLSTFPYREQWSVKHLQSKTEAFVMLFASTQGATGAYIRDAFQDLWNGATLVGHSPFSPTIYIAVDGAANSTSLLRVTLEMGVEGTLETRSLVGGSNNAPIGPAISDAASDALASHPAVQAMARESPNGDSFVSKALKLAKREGMEAWEEIHPIVEQLGGMANAAKSVGAYVGDVAPFLAALI